MESEDPYQAMNDQADLGRRLERTNKLPKHNIPLKLLVILPFFLSFSLSFIIMFGCAILMSNSESSGPESEFCDRC